MTNFISEERIMKGIRYIVCFFIFIAGKSFGGFGNPYVKWSFDPHDLDLCVPVFANIDGIPGSEIIMTSNEWSGSAYLYCVDGIDGSVKWSYNLGSTSASGDHWVSGSPAIADLDADGNPEIIYSNRGVNSAELLYCFSSSGAVKWTYPGSFGPAVIANVDTIGDAEILTSNSDSLYCFNSDRSVKWVSKKKGYIAVSDIYENGSPEVIVATGYDGIWCLNGINGRPIWSFPCTTSTWPAIADIDLDCYAEIVVGCGKTLYCLERDGGLKWTYTPDSLKFSREIAIADLDFLPDNLPEIVIYGGDRNLDDRGYVYCMRENSTGTGAELVWKKENGPQIGWWPDAASVICDIDGDGDRDVICSSRKYLAIYNGTDGNHPDNSGNPFYRDSAFVNYTGEYGTVGDVDGDSVVEIVGIYDVGGIGVLEEDASWANHRDIWSDIQYHICNINDDLTVPRKEPHHWRIHNTWRTQTPKDSVPCPCEEGSCKYMPDIFMSSPNPFVQKTVIKFRVESSELKDLQLQIYDLSGRLVRSLPITDNRTPIHEVTWDGKTDNGNLVPSGIYFCVLTSKLKTHRIQIVLLR